MNNKSQSGHTMIEVLSVLSILGILFVSVMMIVNSMYDKFKSNNIITQIRDLRKGISNRYMALGIYTGLSPKILISERLVPAQMVHGQKLLHSYLGEVNLAVGNTGGSGRSYKITFPKLPYKNCVELATINWEVEATAMLVSISINKTTFTWQVNKASDSGVTQDASTTALPVTMGGASTACKTGNENEITWEFQ